jgi:hypothetical protein
MNNTFLSILKEWRFCNIDMGLKYPRYHNWQNTPLTLEQIPQNNNIGVLLGPQSNGILAIDFDGEWASEYWINNIKCDIPITITWSSGRDCRWQMAFKVPEQYWDKIKTFKLVSEDKKQGLEFRWAGCQSVLPPSIHPDTKQPYHWLLDPEDEEVAELPLDILNWILNYIPETKEIKEVHEVSTEEVTEELFTEIQTILTKIKQDNPTLNYDEWRSITWATISHVGKEIGIQLMKTLWPENKKNEYIALCKNYDKSRSPTLGSLVYKAGYTKTTTMQAKINKMLDVNPSTKKQKF